jgi:hypothetical protein
MAPRRSRAGLLTLTLSAAFATTLAAGARCEKARTPAATPSASASAPSPPPAAAPEKGVQGQPKGTTSGANVVKTEEGKEGVKTYQFRAVEVEGRLRSPQLIYFLRRVRAEFLAGDLGHRSFLPELSETARHAAFR